VGAVLAYLAVEQVDALLGVSLAFAAGAMLALIAVELIPQAAKPGGRALAVAGTLAGAAVMLALAAVLGV
jgi:ZIP family zinc transporter